MTCAEHEEQQRAPDQEVVAGAMCRLLVTAGKLLHFIFVMFLLLDLGNCHLPVVLNTPAILVIVIIF